MCDGIASIGKVADCVSNISNWDRGSEWQRQFHSILSLGWRVMLLKLLEIAKPSSLENIGGEDW